MKIGIDARMLGTGYGIGRYIQQLVLGLEKTDFKNQYVVFLRKKNWGDFTPINNNFKKVLADIPWYGLSEQIKLIPIIEKAKVGLMHFPHWNVPFFYTGRFVVTLHDLIMYHYSRIDASTHGPIIYWLKDKAHRLILKNSVKFAKHIIAASEFTRTDIIENLNVQPEKISVVYQAPSQTEQYSGTEEGLKFILKKYNITKPYILYVGACYPHKNLENLLRAWEIFQKEYNFEYQLVLVGKSNYFYQKFLDGDLFKKSKNVIYTGLVPENELCAIYSASNLFVFPSLYEGFGIPPLEAMTQNIPVISSNASCMPEILGNAAYYFDPKKPEEIARSIAHILIDKQLRERLVNNGQKMCATYSLKNMAEQTINIYESVDK